MAELDPGALAAARQAALADPRGRGLAFALLLADRSQELIRSGEWAASVRLLGEAQAFLRMATGGPLSWSTASKSLRTFSKATDDPNPAEAVPGGHALSNEKSAGISGLADSTLRAIVQAFPPDHPLAATAKSRLGRRILQRGPTVSRDPAVVEEAVGLCLFAVSVTANPGAELLTNLGNALRARFELASDPADLAAAVMYLLRAALDQASPREQLRYAPLADTGDALLAGFAATDETEYLDDAIAAQRDALALLPPDHPDRPALLSNLGAALLSRFERFADAGDLGAALTCLNEAWQAQRGPRDMIGTNLGSALLRRYELTGGTADLAGAIEHLTAAAEAAPAGSAQLLSARSALAEALCVDGQLRPARDLLSDVVLGREAMFGAEHPSTLAARNNLAAIMALLGHLRTAAGEFRDIAAARAAVLGVLHPDTLASRHNLAAALADLGDTDEARAEFKVVVAGRRTVLGADHPDTRASLAALDELGPR
jgi:hypothetical protein